MTTMDVSCWTFIRMAHLAEPLMRKGGTLFTMTYYGSQMVVKNYNIMGVAKAALECAVRYLAAELGPKAFAFMPSRPVRWRRAPLQASPSSTLCSTRRKQRLPREVLSASTTSEWPPLSWLTMRRGLSPAKPSTSTADTISSISPALPKS